MTGRAFHRVDGAPLPTDAAIATSSSPYAAPIRWILRLAGLTAVINGAGFGAFDIPAMWHLARYGTVWNALGEPTYGHGPFEAHGVSVTVPILAAFFVACVVLTVGGLLLLVPRSTGMVVALVGIAVCAPFWWGFHLPGGWTMAAATVILLSLAWVMHWHAGRRARK
ncbi:MAG: hypothetical protein GC156_09975 [Actinomycetales bacterium]|nr:hypothetical protein [Actinomycetales bacterium]